MSKTNEKSGFVLSEMKETGKESDSKENEQEEENEETDVEITDRTLLCGWGKWRPKFLQKFTRPSMFLFFLVLFAVTAGILSGLTAVNLPDIEKEFGLSSKQSAVILLANDIGGMIMVPVFSFYGAHGKKPKWIGIGAIISGIGGLFMILPKLMIGYYVLPGFTKRSNFCATDHGTNAVSCSGSEGYSSAGKYLGVFCFAQFIIGLGVSPLWPLGPAYLDENVNPKVAPIYVGIWFVGVFLGRGLGYAVGGAFSSIFTNVAMPKGVAISRRDPRWIGAWWFGFFVFAWLAVISGVMMICFPREMPKYRKKRLDAIKAGKLPTENKEIGKGLKDLLKALIDLMKNKTYVFSSLGLTVKIIFAAALGGFYTKILVLKFGGSLSQISLLSAAVFIPGNTIGVGIGSLIMKKMPVKNAAKNASLLLVFTGITLSIFSTVWILPGCKSTNIAGATVPYKNSTGKYSLKSACNSHCHCPRRSYEPVCGEDGLTYFSPCHAGCQSTSLKGSINCSCIISNKLNARFNSTGNLTGSFSENEDASGFGSAFIGRCDRQCKNLFVFLGLSALNLMISFSASIPQKMLTLRCVADNQRAFGLGIQLVFLRLLSLIPGPIIMGSIIDSNCLLWGKDECGNRGNCLEYNVDQLSYHFFIFAIVAAVTATIFYFLGWFFYVAPPVETDGKLDNNENSNLLKNKDPEP